MEKETKTTLNQDERWKAERVAGRYLTFKLDKEGYGIEILGIQEIIGLMPITSVPKAPDYMRGVIDLRGKAIPVVDLRAKFGMTPKADTELTCIVVVRLRKAAQVIVMGVVVDEVSEVLYMRAGQIEPPPSLGTSVDAGFILGVGKVGEKIVMLLDVEQALNANEMFALEMSA